MKSSSSRRRLGQIVCGPPGAGKSTYCDGMSQFFNAIGRKSTFIINLDPASVGNADSYGTFVQNYFMSFFAYHRTHNTNVSMQEWMFEIWWR
jgi:adenylate kinase family enzyme